MLPAKEDLLGKLNYTKGMKDQEEQAALSVCYMAYVALKSRETPEKGPGGDRNAASLHRH